MAVALVLLANLHITNAAECAGTHTDDASGTCYCVEGYWGDVDTQAGTSTCSQCPNNSTTNTAGASNTGPAVTAAACDRCPIGQYMATAASGSTAATCTPCPAKSEQLSVQTAPGFCTCKDPNAAALSATQTTCECTQGYTGNAADTNVSTCTQCAAGTFKGAAGSAACTACPVGKYSALGASACLDCAAGKTSNAGKTACEDCTAGTYSAAASTDGCVACPVGKYSALGASACLDCAAGKTSNAGKTACEDCAAGKTSTLGSADGCVNCAAGTFSAAAGSTSCTACTGSKFSSAGATACTDCAAGSKVKIDFTGCDCYDTGAGTETWTAAVNKCQCKANYYGDPSTKAAAATDSCTICPDEGTSAAGSTAVASCTAASTNSIKLFASFALALVAMLL